MKKTMTTFCVAAAASWLMTAVPQAQSTTGTTGSQTGQTGSSGSSQKSAHGKNVTLTGCLQEGQTPGTYTLTNVSESGSADTSGTSGSGSSGTSGNAAGSGSGAGSMSGESGYMGSPNVELVPSKGVDLKAHVGHKIQVTGMPSMDNAKTGKQGTSGSGASGSGTSGSGSSGSGMSGQSGSSSMSGSMEHKIRVQSVKHISDTCGGE